MLEVHPPHHTPNTWRDFFIHIATIVVGLLIAVGIEQTVEYIHHRRQVAETREALRLELEENRARFSKYLANYRWETAELTNNMSVFTYLAEHPGAPQTALPGVLYWHVVRSLFAHAAWDTAQQSGVLTLMPASEVLAEQNLYHALNDITTINEEKWLALNEVRRFMFRDSNPAHLTSAQIATELDLMEELMTKHYLQGNFLGYPTRLDASFPPGPSPEYLREFQNFDYQTSPELAAVRARTFDRLKAAGYVPVPLPAPKAPAGSAQPTAVAPAKP